eukprot:CAMPEP_0119105464 /NCGR_PEP_ID=MMETSP1180-20130426/3409_1 /TAXON_ID=3052 ORGANISM="Chlamydomonas cf sp, Strain CCMP681" /NCGR_SAMPLE_ID=MMETSP1180 /ASSEMBLY_ACC=CAM_ASM_000741 /LENGTH=1060 /DNA_ID=CAMNT_0007090509 /DNA_START=65 /DNA_END=3247 /DNA_ORIENTATION=+
MDSRQVQEVRFKKPLTYDSGLASATLAKALEMKKKRSGLLAQLGLADDDGLDIDTDDEGIEEELELQGTPAVTEAMLERRHISVQQEGVANHRTQLLGRAQVPGVQAKEIIDDLVCELWAMTQEIKALDQQVAHAARQPHSISTVSQTAAMEQSAAVLEQYEDDIRALQRRVVQLEGAALTRGAHIRSLQSQLESSQKDLLEAKSQVQSGTDALDLQTQALEAQTRSLAEQRSQLEALEAATKRTEIQQTLQQALHQATSAEASPQAPSAPSNGHGKMVWNDTTRANEPAGAGVEDDADVGGLDSGALLKLHVQLQELQAQLAARDSQLESRDSQVASLNAQLRSHSSSLSNTRLGANAGKAEIATHLEMLQAALAVKEAKLTEAASQITQLRAGGARNQRERTADESVVVREAMVERDEAWARLTMLEAELKKAYADQETNEADFAAKLLAITSATEHQQAAKLQKQVWELTQQHEQRVAELEAEVKQKAKQALQTKSDSMKQASSAAAQVQQARAGAAVEVRSQLEHLRTELAKLHDFREGVLGDLLAMKNDIFTDQMAKQMTRMVRDKEVLAINKAKGEGALQVEAAKQKVRDAQDQVEAMQDKCDQQLHIMELESQGQIRHFKSKWQEEFDKRKKLHNQLSELRGSIRVICRIRPLLPKEVTQMDANAPHPVRVVTEESLRIAMEKGEREFEFDRVFGPKEGQEPVFTEVASLVTSALDGYNVCIMAYGQTGSGKTHTMEGPESDPGVNTRALAELFKLSTERVEEWQYTFNASVLEIYNEQIYDLLSGGREQDGDKLDVKQGPEGMHVPGLKLEEVRSIDDVANFMKRGKQSRSTFATNMNEHSSRSHLVLSVYVQATSKTGAPSMRGKLHLIDLAGSERVGRSGAQGDRLKEAQSINKSLSAMGDVIQALQQKNAHIPYRNSKLTRLLEDSLGGQAKCVLVVNCSPAAENVPETKCSLEFASRARKVELGKARQHVDSAPPSPALSISNGMVRPGSAPPRPPTTPAARATPHGTPEHSNSRTSVSGSARGTPTLTPETSATRVAGKSGLPRVAH